MMETMRALLGDAAVRAARPDDAVHGIAPAVVIVPDGAEQCAAALRECTVAAGRSRSRAGAARVARDGRSIAWTCCSRPGA